MPRLGQVGKDDAHPLAQTIYRMLFDDRDPVVEIADPSGRLAGLDVMAVVDDS